MRNAFHAKKNTSCDKITHGNGFVIYLAYISVAGAFGKFGFDASLPDSQSEKIYLEVKVLWRN